MLNPFVPSSLPNCALHPPASVCLLLLWGSQRQADAQGCRDPAGICSWEDTGEVAAMQTGPACSLPSFTVGALPPAVLHSSPSPHQASPQGKLCPCCPGPVWAPGVVGSAVGAPAGAWWPPTWSGFAWEHSGVAAHPLAMCSAWQTSCWWPGIPAPLPSPCFLSSLKAFLGNRRLEITLLSDVLLKEPFAAWWRGSVLAERACTQRCFSGDLGARRPHATVAA